jgi:excisionase family DNA binding protein
VLLSRGRTGLDTLFLWKQPLPAQRPNPHQASSRTRTGVAEEQELLSPQQAGDRLGFSRQHVVRLINAGELEARKLPGSSYWQIPLAAILAFEERSQRAGELADEFSRSLDALGAPLE